MPLFSVLFQEDDEKTKDLITSNYKHLFIEPNYCIISTPENVPASAISKKLGIWDKEKNRSSYGVVFKLNGSYSGFASVEFWNWLDQEIS